MDEGFCKIAGGIGKLDYPVTNCPFSQQRTQKKAQVFVECLWKSVLFHTRLLNGRIEWMKINGLLGPQSVASIQNNIIANG